MPTRCPPNIHRMPTDAHPGHPGRWWGAGIRRRENGPPEQVNNLTGGRQAYACGLAAGVVAGAGGVSVSGPLAGDGFASLGFDDDGTKSLRD